MGVKEAPSKAVEDPLEDLIALRVMHFIYKEAKELIERFPAQLQEAENLLTPFEPGKNNFLEQIEDLKPAHQALADSIENGLGNQPFSRFFTFPEELKDFDRIVEKTAQTVDEEGLEAVTISIANDVILGETLIEEIAIRYRAHIEELVLDVLSEHCEEEKTEEVLHLLKITDTKLKARKSELGKTLVEDILSVREQIRSQYVDPALSEEERDGNDLEAAIDEAIDEEPVPKGGLSLDKIEELLGGLSPTEEAVMRMLKEIKKIRINSDLKRFSDYETLSAGDLIRMRKLEEKAHVFLSKRQAISD